MTGWWKWTSGILATFLVVALTFAVSAATRPAVSEKRVKEIISTDSPYIQDRQLIAYRLDQILERLGQVETRLTRVEESIRDMAFNPGITPGK